MRAIASVILAFSLACSASAVGADDAKAKDCIRAALPDRAFEAMMNLMSDGRWSDEGAPASCKFERDEKQDSVTFRCLKHELKISDCKTKPRVVSVQGPSGSSPVSDEDRKRLEKCSAKVAFPNSSDSKVTFEQITPACEIRKTQTGFDQAKDNERYYKKKGFFEEITSVIGTPIHLIASQVHSRTQPQEGAALMSCPSFQLLLTGCPVEPKPATAQKENADDSWEVSGGEFEAD